MVVNGTMLLSFDLKRACLVAAFSRQDETCYDPSGLV